jgi:hypothetical protein
MDIAHSPFMKPDAIPSDGKDYSSRGADAKAKTGKPQNLPGDSETVPDAVSCSRQGKPPATPALAIPDCPGIVAMFCRKTRPKTGSPFE